MNEKYIIGKNIACLLEYFYFRKEFLCREQFTER